LDVAAFIGRLESAFPDPGCPPEWLPTCTCWECTELAAFLKERPLWRRFSAEDCFAANTCALMGRAFAYYLPAFIVASLTDPEAADVGVLFAAWMFLPYPPEDGKPNVERFRSFTAEQRSLILEWLAWFAETEAIDGEQREGYAKQIDILRQAVA